MNRLSTKKIFEELQKVLAKIKNYFFFFFARDPSEEGSTPKFERTGQGVLSLVKGIMISQVCCGWL